MATEPNPDQLVALERVLAETSSEDAEKLPELQVFDSLEAAKPYLERMMDQQVDWDCHPQNVNVEPYVLTDDYYDYMGLAAELGHNRLAVINQATFWEGTFEAHRSCRTLVSWADRETP